jgi:hypothetical protein
MIRSISRRSSEGEESWNGRRPAVSSGKRTCPRTSPPKLTGSLLGDTVAQREPQSNIDKLSV